MRVAILTSSRADYGIYKPLIIALNEHPSFHLSIIAFGSHLSAYHGYTVDEIRKDGFKVDYEIRSVLLTDDEESVATSIGLTMIKFAGFWSDHASQFDWVFCLGDRYEMFAAVMAGLSFGVRFAHIHGGETTLGAIDNTFRHCITLASQLHFVSADVFADRVKAILGEQSNNKDVVVTGALSLDNLRHLKLLTTKEFLDKWSIDLSMPSILITIHPETVNASENATYLEVVKSVINVLKDYYQLIITMPNTDTHGSQYRNLFKALGENDPGKIKLIENFGTQSYFTCINGVKLMIGNTSSGIIEAASFNKYVINLGDRQKGRLHGDNVFDVAYDKGEILNALAHIESLKRESFKNIYFKGGAVDKIIDKLISIA
ncbi:MAG: UDP-N-acetylglucosamine 2-epimerase (hydrolyzing) [Bacteroidetes bacterium]|nr:UDP-N-acetylglucosamine 2-epimerase (hydrolyzing) [Bacteroidota bacterium]